MHRLKEIRIEFNLNQKELAKKLGRKQATISAIELGKYPMEKVMALAIEAVLGINAEWLLTGKEPKYKIGAIRASTEHEPDLAWASIIHENKEAFIIIPILGDVPGVPYTKKNIKETIKLHTDIFPEYTGYIEDLIALQIKDDSMLHEGLKKDNIIIVHEQSNVKNGELAIILHADEIILRKYYKYTNNLILRSTNPSYKDITIPIEDFGDIEILGKVILSISNWTQRTYL